jgi:hypothetical protein
MCEIPYAKYLDCGYDQFEEAAIAHWLSAGASPNGMVIRLQGFDRGVFGGNFHTHNTIHIPPGLDVRMHYSICMRKPVFLACVFSLSFCLLPLCVLKVIILPQDRLGTNIGEALRNTGFSPGRVL